MAAVGVNAEVRSSESRTEPVRRRAIREPFMAMMSGRDDALPGPIPLEAINSGASVLERALGRRLFPIR